MTAIPPLRVIGISWKAWGFEKSLSSKSASFNFMMNIYLQLKK